LIVIEGGALDSNNAFETESSSKRREWVPIREHKKDQKNGAWDVYYEKPPGQNIQERGESRNIRNLRG